MRKINKARATFLLDKFGSNSLEMNICHMIARLFESEPSYTEQTVCNTCNYSNSIAYPLVKMNDEIFSNDLSNIEKAIKGYLPDKLFCTKCKSDLQLQWEFGHHLFVEVYIVFSSFFVRLFMNNVNIYNS